MSQGTCSCIHGCIYENRSQTQLSSTGDREALNPHRAGIQQCSVPAVLTRESLQTHSSQSPALAALAWQLQAAGCPVPAGLTAWSHEPFESRARRTELGMMHVFYRAISPCCSSSGTQSQQPFLSAAGGWGQGMWAWSRGEGGAASSATCAGRIQDLGAPCCSSSQTQMQGSFGKARRARTQKEMVLFS